MCTAESSIHQNVKEAIVAGSELDTELIFRPLRNTARVPDNTVSREVVEILNRGGEFPTSRTCRRRRVGSRCSRTVTWYAGIWSVAPRWA